MPLSAPPNHGIVRARVNFLINTVRNTTVLRRYQFHDIDITLSGTRVTFRFTADLPGSHIVESHDTGKVICTFVIS